ncbi:MAG TPA: hypothetical protein VMV46_23205 [Thermoanaerobaculia bacterium]|nr:hypothetical protein [Thermoanaerobaculia bacterium]
MILMVASTDDTHQRVDPSPEERTRAGARREESSALTFRQVGELVARCAELHRELAFTLERRAPEAPGEEQRTLLQSLAKSERKLAQSLERAFRGHRRKDGAPGDDESWVQNAPASLLQDAEQRSGRLAQVAIHTLDAEAAIASRLLTRFFDELQASAPTPSQQELLESLRALEERFDRRHSSSVASGLV